MACLHWIQLLDILEEPAAGVALQHILAFLILISLFADRRMYTVVLLRCLNTRTTMLADLTQQANDIAARLTRMAILGLYAVRFSSLTTY